MANSSKSPTKLAPYWVWALVVAATLVLLVVFIAIIVWVPALLVQRDGESSDAYVKALTDNRTALVQAVGGFGVFVGVIVGVFTLRHNRQLLKASRIEHEETIEASRDALQKTLAFNRESFELTMAINQRGQVTDRFTKAIEQMGKSGGASLDVRLGGIYALEQIAQDSPDLHWPIFEILSAYVRQHARGLPLPEGKGLVDRLAPIVLRRAKGYVDPLPIDIQAAITVIGRRDRNQDGARLLDLRGSDFRRAGFRVGAKLDGIDFEQAKLHAASLGGADLHGSNLFQAELQGAELNYADLRGARLWHAQVAFAEFIDAKLDGAELEFTDLSQARGLTSDQLRVAKVDETTVLPRGIDYVSLGIEVRTSGDSTSAVPNASSTPG